MEEEQEEALVKEEGETPFIVFKRSLIGLRGVSGFPVSWVVIVLRDR